MLRLVEPSALPQRRSEVQTHRRSRLSERDRALQFPDGGGVVLPSELRVAQRSVRSRGAGSDLDGVAQVIPTRLELAGVDQALTGLEQQRQCLAGAAKAMQGVGQAGVGVGHARMPFDQLSELLLGLVEPPGDQSLARARQRVFDLVRGRRSGPDGQQEEKGE